MVECTKLDEPFNRGHGEEQRPVPASISSKWWCHFSGGNAVRAVSGEAGGIGAREDDFNVWHAELEVSERHLTRYAHESISGMTLRNSLG